MQGIWGHKSGKRGQTVPYLLSASMSQHTTMLEYEKCFSDPPVCILTRPLRGLKLDLPVNPCKVPALLQHSLQADPWFSYRVI